MNSRTSLSKFVDFVGPMLTKSLPVYVSAAIVSLSNWKPNPETSVQSITARTAAKTAGLLMMEI